MIFQMILKMMNTSFHLISASKVPSLLFLTWKEKKITILMYFYPTRQESALISYLLMSN